MAKTKIFGKRIDALTICYKCNTEEDTLMKIMSYKIRGKYDFYLRKTTMARYSNCYKIYAKDGDSLIGELRFGLCGSMEYNLFWIAVNNKFLYEAFQSSNNYSSLVTQLQVISEALGLILNNITLIDICVDSSINVANLIKRYLRDKSITTILNNKKILDRKEDRSEVLHFYSGDMNRFKYHTAIIKQKKAINDKSKGLTITAYDKKAEIKNKSNKTYILTHYHNPKKLYRLEAHINMQNIKAFIKKKSKGKEDTAPSVINLYEILNIDFLYDAFLDSLNRVIRFQKKGKNLDWGTLFA